MLPSDSSTIVTVRQVSGESTQVSGPITMWAQPIQIQLQATDSSLFTTATSTSASASNSATATATSTSTSASGAPSSSSSSGLSQGASIGIGVGVGVGGALIIAALAFWFFRRRKTKKNMDQSYQRAGHPEASELGGSSQQTAPESVGTHTRSTNPSELAADQGPKPVHELYG
jgi:beta-lactamase regulating signal transducer with metallopeptidase domain